MSAASGGVWCAARVLWAGRPRARRGERAARAFRVRAGADVASDSSAEKCPPLRNLLGAADDKAWAHVLSSPEGRELSCLPLRVVSMRMLRLRDALSAVSDLDVAAMAIEQPGLLLFDGDWDAEVPRVWNAVERALGPDVRLARLADACPCAFAIVLRRSMTMEGDRFPEDALVKRLGAPLVKWVRGADPTDWFGVFSSCVGSEWGYLHTMESYATKTVEGTTLDAFRQGSAYKAKNKQLRPQTSHIRAPVARRPTAAPP